MRDSLPRSLVVPSLLLALAALPGCVSPTSPEERELDANRELFRARVGSSYSCDYRNVAFAIGPFVERVRMTVRDGRVVSLVSLETGQEVTQFREEFLTVEEIFDEIERALDDAYSVQVEYDPELGYPRETYIDFDERVADEERGFSISNLVPGA